MDRDGQTCSIGYIDAFRNIHKPETSLHKKSRPGIFSYLRSPFLRAKYRNKQSNRCKNGIYMQPTVSDPCSSTLGTPSDRCHDSPQDTNVKCDIDYDYGQTPLNSISKGYGVKASVLEQRDASFRGTSHVSVSSPSTHIADIEYFVSSNAILYFASRCSYDLKKIIKLSDVCGVYLLYDTINRKYIIGKTTIENECHISKLIDVINKTGCNNLLTDSYYRYTTNTCYSFYTYINGSSLKEYLENDVLDEKMMLHFFRQLLHAVQCLHNNNIIHRDVKTDNIMIRADNTLFLIDYDYGVISENLCINTTHMTGSDEYMAPESRFLQNYSDKSDIWSLGVILYYLLVQKYPVNSIIYTDPRVSAKTHNDIDSPNMEQKKYLYENIDFEAVLHSTMKCNNIHKYKTLCQSILQFDKKNRMCIDGILDIIN